MVNRLEKTISKERWSSAVTNYLHCLNLPEHSSILILTDLIPPIMKTPPDPNLLVRRGMAEKLNTKLSQEIFYHDYYVGLGEYDRSMTQGDFYDKTKDYLEQLGNAAGRKKSVVTVIYLGDEYSGRQGIYYAASDFGKDRKVRIANSLGFSAGDCLLLADMDTSKLYRIKEQVGYFDNFFNEHPRGVFNVLTEDNEKKTYSLRLGYDVSKAPFVNDLARFGEGHTRKYINAEYANIPGGETYAAPYPYQSVHGHFFADNLLFTVENGLVTGVGPDYIPAESFEPSQRELIRLIRSGLYLPVAELGIGFHELAGIQAYPGSSMLSRERIGPHIGIGQATSPTDEDSLIKASTRTSSFFHADFVLPTNPIIYWNDSQMNPNNRIKFYPPPK